MTADEVVFDIDICLIVSPWIRLIPLTGDGVLIKVVESFSPLPCTPFAFEPHMYK